MKLPVVGWGVLEYAPNGQHRTEVSEVEFLLTPSSERVLRQRGPSTTVFESNSWVFQDEDVDHIRSIAAPQHASFTSPKQEGRSDDRSLSPSPTHSNLPTKPDVASFPSKERSVALLDLRNELLLKLGSRWSLPRRVSALNGEGIYSHQLEVTVGCTLRSLRQIANIVRTRVTGGRSLSVPSFEDLVRCSLAIDAVHIYLHSLWDICEVLDIRDRRDYNEMVVKVSSGSKGKCLIIMGSAGQKEEQRDGTSCALNRLIVGSSAMPTLPSKLLTSTSSTISCASPPPSRVYGPHNVVIQQQRNGWDEGLRCYTSKWETVTLEEQDSMPYDMEVGDSTIHEATRHCFQFHWKPADTPSPRRWSKDALNNGDEVLGYLSLSLPTVACVGAHTVRGVKNALNNSRDDK